MKARASVPTLPVPLLRDGIAREAARYSLRRVAREVGMSPNGLRDFLRGALPRSATRAKLEQWLASQGQVTRPPNMGQFIRLLNHLAVDLSPDQTKQFGRAIAELLVESGRNVPRAMKVAETIPLRGTFGLPTTGRDTWQRALSRNHSLDRHRNFHQ